MFKKSAFTLAEVLLVIGVIGAVSMLTVTNARKGTDIAEKLTQLRKTHEILESVTQQAIMAMVFLYILIILMISQNQSRKQELIL